MKNLLKLILASFIFLSATPAPAMDFSAGMEEVKKKKKKKGEKAGKGKKKKKGFFSKVFGAK